MIRPSQLLKVASWTCSSSSPPWGWPTTNNQLSKDALIVQNKRGYRSYVYYSTLYIDSFRPGLGIPAYLHLLHFIFGSCFFPPLQLEEETERKNQWTRCACNLDKKEKAIEKYLISTYIIHPPLPYNSNARRKNEWLLTKTMYTVPPSIKRITTAGNSNGK